MKTSGKKRLQTEALFLKQQKEKLQKFSAKNFLSVTVLILLPLQRRTSIFHAFCIAFFFLYGLQCVNVFSSAACCCVPDVLDSAYLMGNNLMLYPGKESLISPHSQAESKKDV